ncbi:hypothetical protein LOC67_26760 [Stieleria sp. JC731]|uniref:hypothetical protein n=1 Tax=Pirellulaceae TaxID=2691357 RepID=UPI001E5A8BB3|nr:hypothetical protein [Stieleria sp. JC731]MCC9604171.1 hypothetical protein [Stieleria sp. JC731]
MDARKYLTCFWPGLSELWWRGRLSALPAAIAFGVGLNAYLILKYLFPTWLDPTLVRSAFWVGAIVWIYWSLKSIRELPALIAPREATQTPDHFPEAQAAYLSGDWEKAESLLLQVLRVESRDPPALLLLSSVYRYLERPQHSLALLAEISRLEVGDHWHIELQAELARAERMLEERDVPESEAATDDAAEMTAA